MNRDITDIKKEYIDLVRKAYTMRKVWRNDVVDLVRGAWMRYLFIRKYNPDYQIPMEKELREMVATFTSGKNE